MSTQPTCAEPWPHDITSPHGLAAWPRCARRPGHDGMHEARAYYLNALMVVAASQILQWPNAPVAA